jgi:hypothetical protein
MNRALRLFLPALAALLTITASVAAQTVPSSYRYIETNRSVSLYVGYLNTSPGLAVTDSTSVDLGPKSTPMFGLRGSFGLGGPLSLEAHLAYAPAKRDLYEAFIDLTKIGEVDEALLLAEGAFRFRLTGDRTFRGVAPFVLASGGLVVPVSRTTVLEDSVDAHRRLDFGPSFAVGTGAGFDFFPSQRMSLRLEGTYRLWRLEAPAGLLPRGRGKVSGWSANSGISLGAVYHF